MAFQKKIIFAKMEPHIVKIIVSVAAIILISFAVQDSMWKEDSLIRWSAAITMISVAFSPIWYFLTSHISRKRERRHASENLYEELKDARHALDYDKHPQNFVTITYQEDKQEKKYSFMNRDLNHDIYDSLVSSGKINFLTADLQQSIQDIFKRIKRHNVDTERIMEVVNDTAVDDGSDDNGLDEKYFKYLEWLVDAENRLIKDIPRMMVELRKRGFV